MHNIKATAGKGARRAFTLIELLIVIAIIAILATILFPVFARARENARRSACMSNLRQIGLAFAQYTQDYDETYPVFMAFSLPGLTTISSWDQSIAPYAGVTVDPNASPTIFKCPSDSIARTTATNGGRSYAVPMVAIGNNDYSLVNSIVTTASSGTYFGRKISSLPVPSETILLTERPFASNLFAQYSGVFVYCAQTNGGNCSRTSEPWGTLNGGQDSGMAGKQIHFDGWNYLFCDGHVKWLRPEKTVDLNPNDGIVGSLGDAASAPNIPRGMWSVREGD